MKDKTIQIQLSEDLHRKLKAQAVLEAENLPKFAAKIISEALQNKQVFQKWISNPCIWLEWGPIQNNQINRIAVGCPKHLDRGANSRGPCFFLARS